MNITSIEQVNMVDCCGCPWPTCPEPVKECQSITVQACGELIPVDVTAEPEDTRYVPKSDRCKIFKRVVYNSVDTVNYTGPTEEGSSIGGSQVDTANCQYDFVWKTEYPGGPGTFPERECNQDLSTTYTINHNLTTYEDGEAVSNTTSSGGSSSSPTSPCSGSVTNTFTEEGEEPVVDVVPYNECPCPAAVDLTDGDVTYTSVGVFSLTIINTPGPDSTGSTVFTITYSEQLTLSDLVTEIAARAALYGTTHDWPGSECNSSVKYAYGYEEEDPDEDAEPVCTQVTEATKARYRFSIPSGYYPGRSTFEVTWDEYFFPTVWDEWDAKVEAYEAWEVLHQNWVDSGMVGPEPVEPEEPGAEPDEKPELIAEREWEWDGTNTNDHSEWFVMDLPETSDEPGEVRTVNVAVNCWVSTRLGRKPTWYGEIYTPPAMP